MYTPGPWKRRSIPGHLFELKNAAGDIVFRIRGGLMPVLEDARLLEAAPEMRTLLRKAQSFLSTSVVESEEVWAEIDALLTRIDKGEA